MDTQPKAKITDAQRVANVEEQKKQTALLSELLEELRGLRRDLNSKA